MTDTQKTFSTVHSLSLTLCVVSYRMTEEEREKAQEQLKALNQAYSELSQSCSDQTTSAEEVGHKADSSIEWFAFVCYDVLENSTT